MSPRDLVYVGHMLDMARKAVGKTQGLRRDAYDADENLRLALTHLIQVIGEAARHVSREFTAQHPEIPTRWSIALTPGVVLWFPSSTMLICNRPHPRRDAFRRRNHRLQVH
jgi:hypothetical protein